MARPEIYKKKVDASKIDLKPIEQWISSELLRLLPDDDIVIEYLYELIEMDTPDIDEIDSQMSEFLGPKDGRKFCKELWEKMVANETEKVDTEGNEPKNIQAGEENRTNYNRSRKEKPLTNNPSYRSRDDDRIHERERSPTLSANRNNGDSKHRTQPRA